MTQDDLILKDIKEYIKNSGRILEVQYNTWITAIEKAKFGRTVVFLWVPNSIAKNSIEERYKDLIEDAIYQRTRKEYKIVVLLRGDTEPPEEDPEFKGDLHRIVKDDSGLLNSKYTFDNFIVGNSNRFAHAYALSVAESPGGLNNHYNPLFLYGGPGLGKTHLCHAIGNFVKQNSPGARVLFVSSEKYTNEFIASLSNKTTLKFRDKYRSADILIIDDIQFIAGKESTIEEFFHTFNELYENGKQIVLASDRPPKEINIEERIKSRFEAGLLCDITPPDFETRIAILKSKAGSMGISFSDDVYSYIADNIKSNVRKLEGALLKISAYKSLNQGELDEETVGKVLNDFVVSDENNKITFSMVINAVTSYFHISKEELLGDSRRKEVANIRQICMYLCTFVKGSNSSSIGRELNRDRSTVVYAINKISHDIKYDEEVRATVEDVKKSII